MCFDALDMRARSFQGSIVQKRSRGTGKHLARPKTHIQITELPPVVKIRNCAKEIKKKHVSSKIDIRSWMHTQYLIHETVSTMIEYWRTKHLAALAAEYHICTSDNNLLS